MAALLTSPPCGSLDARQAGLLALRERRMKVSHAEFRKAREYVKRLT